MILRANALHEVCYVFTFYFVCVSTMSVKMMSFPSLLFSSLTSGEKRSYDIQKPLPSFANIREIYIQLDTKGLLRFFHLQSLVKFYSLVLSLHVLFQFVQLPLPRRSFISFYFTMCKPKLISFTQLIWLKEGKISSGFNENFMNVKLTENF